MRGEVEMVGADDSSKELTGGRDGEKGVDLKEHMAGKGTGAGRETESFGTLRQRPMLPRDGSPSHLGPPRDLARGASWLAGEWG